MGGFFYVAKECGRDRVSATAAHARSLDALARKGLSETRKLPRGEVVEREAFVLHLFGKIGCDAQNIVHFPGRDFASCTGTLMYKNLSGENALRELFGDFDPGRASFNDLRGQFCVFLYKQGQLFVFTDYFGVYHVFANEAHTVISNSFVALVRSLETKAISKQALFEYVADGASYAGETYIKGVRALDAFSVHQLSPRHSRIEKRFEAPPLKGRVFEERVDGVIENLTDYWGALRRCFGEDACLGLSGGYDSRLILALLIQAGMKPKAYVYGGERSPDVLVSKAIGRGEGIAVHHDCKQPRVSDGETFRSNVRLEYFYSDGYGQNGAFTDGSEMAARAHRTSAAPLQLNGGGGETFRNFWKLPDRPVTAMEFLQSRYDPGVEGVFTAAYDRHEYLEKLAEKVKQMLRTDGERLTPRQVEMLYIYMRVKYWMGHNTSIQNFRTWALIPLVEPVFAFPSWDIPLAEKNLGRFEAALIRRLNRRLAGYTSVYGFDFLGPVPLRARAANFLQTSCPVSVRPALRGLRSHLRRPRRRPLFMRDGYLGAVLDRPSPTSEFVDLRRIRDPLMLSRALTVDLVMADPY